MTDAVVAVASSAPFGATDFAPLDGAAELIRQANGPGGVDTRRLAQALAAEETHQSPGAFRQTLKAVEDRLCPADLARLSQDRREETSLNRANRGFSAAARPAADDALQLLHEPKGALSQGEVVSALDKLHQARGSSAATDSDRRSLLSLYLSVYARGAAETSLPPRITDEVMEASVGAMAFGGGRESTNGLRKTAGINEAEGSILTRRASPVLGGRAPAATALGEEGEASSSLTNQHPASAAIANGGLVVHEAAGGHLIAGHVGKTLQQLQARLTAHGVSGASSFNDMKVAEDAVSRTLNMNKAKIDAWLNSSKSRLVIQADTGEDIGVSLRRAPPSVSTASSVKLVLDKDPTMQHGFRIKTGYPIAK